MENELASARKLLATRVESARLSEANTKLAEADALIAKGLAVVHDFLPNIGRCVLQDYQRMNEFCSESAARAADPTPVIVYGPDEPVVASTVQQEASNPVTDSSLK